MEMKKVLQIPQSSKSGNSSLDCFVLYLGHCLWGSLTPLQRCYQLILLSQQTGLVWFGFLGFMAYQPL